MNGINEQIKHAKSSEEIEKLLQIGSQQANATQRTLNRRAKIAAKRKRDLLRPK